TEAPMTTAFEAELLRGDGSDRGFLRISGSGCSLIAVLPSPTMPGALVEARAVWEIGRHLARRSVPVPELFGFDPATGIVLCEDLGNRQFQGMGAAGSLPLVEVAALYRQGLELLLQMQFEGGVDFDTRWCWDTPTYDRQLMLSRESGYFREACCRDYLGMTDFALGLEADFQRLAELAARQPAGFFMHRDFQSRNLIVKAGRLRVLDFQGGRLGPLAYDLASFLNDPYVDLPVSTRSELFDYYLRLLTERAPELAPGFAEGYLWLALQRNLQILGAFAFLCKVKGKVFFRDYLVPAAVNLNRLLQEPGCLCLPEIRALAAELPDRFKHIQFA
ncbi:MAG TPA: phosphotransferase, partial [Desulfurivibrionaceae bacterium]|nr:phosphotransferase [Desulfurivibrionaceae bacterium]